MSTPGGTSDHEKCCCEIRSSAAEHVLSSWYRPPSQRRKRRHLVPIRATDITTVFFDLCSVRRRRALEGAFADARGHSRGGNARPLTTASRTVAVTHEAPSARRMGDLQLHTSLVSGVHLGDMHCIPPFAQRVRDVSWRDLACLVAVMWQSSSAVAADRCLDTGSRERTRPARAPGSHGERWWAGTLLLLVFLP